MLTYHRTAAWDKPDQPASQHGITAHVLIWGFIFDQTYFETQRLPIDYYTYSLQSRLRRSAFCLTLNFLLLF
jgi:hypothetical protein